MNAKVFEGIRSDNINVPNWPQQDGSFKLSAGWLIEMSGFPRGYVAENGRAGSSTKHALAIINRGNATAQDIYDLSRSVSEGVYNTFGVQLEPEVVFVGFDQICQTP